MREIKFRFWHIKTKSMYEDTGLSSLGLNHSVYLAEVAGYKLMQYTGLKDKNGKEIYEGDIITFLDGEVESTESGYQVNEQQSTGIVEWCQYELRWDITNRLSIEMDEFDENELEVIGNIHENPELLTK